MIVSVIIAASENNVIGKDNKLPWHLPADLKYFKNLTMGHHVIMGRKTYESIGKILPGRTFIIVTRQKEYKVGGAFVVHSIREAIQTAEKAGESEVFVIGGAEIIHESLPLVDKLYLTRIHADVDGDTYLSLPETVEWIEENKTSYEKDEKHAYAFSFLELIKKR